MPKFFITTPMQNNGKPFQFNFETTEVADVREFCDVLEKGGFVYGERFDNRDPNNPSKRNEMAISASMASMIQPALPYRGPAV